VDANASYDLKGWAWTLAGTWRIASDPASKMDVIAGARLFDMKQTFAYELTGNVGSIPAAGRAGTSEAKLSNWDAIVGVKGRFAFNFVHHPDRLTQPLVRGEDGELHPTTWEHAIETAANGLQKVIAEHGPQAIGFLASARLTNEENYLIQKLARTGVGTNSVHSCEST
jgi:anaerobic selenocysteine-containing dehydrogenase